MDNLIRFLKCIGIENTDKYVNIKINKVIVDKNNDEIDVCLDCLKYIEPSMLDEILNNSKNGINGKTKCKVYLTNDKLSQDEIINVFKYVLNKFISKKPSLSNLENNNVIFDEGVIILEVNTQIEEELILDNVKSFVNEMSNLGVKDINITTKINVEENKKIQEEMNNSHKDEIVEKEVNPVFIGKHIDGDVTKIDDILGETKNIIIEAYIFGEIVTLEKENINIITIKVSDKTNSIIAKIFKRDHDDFKEVLCNLKEKKWYRIHGNVEYDNFAKEIVLSVRNMENISSKDTLVKDDAEVKRVELHAHTMMSTMDGVISATDLVNFAIKLGHRGVAITDHNGCQSFPEAFKAINKFNKGKEEKDKFKGLYGTELNVVNDDVNVVFNVNENNYELLEALSHITGLTINELEEALKEETNASYENMLINLYTNGGTKVIAGNIKVNDEEIIRFTNDEEIFNLELIDDFASISIVYENNTLECIYEELNTILFTIVIKQTDDSEQISITVNDDTKIYKIDIKLSNMKTTKDTLSLDYTLDYNMNDEVTLKLDGTLEITKEELTDISSSTNLDDLTEEELQLFYENFMSILDKFNLTDYLI